MRLFWLPYLATDPHLERALFVLERGFHPLFNVANGLSRLPYARVENRSLYLALFRQILSLGNRGCWRTGLEFCKLLMSYVAMCSKRARAYRRA